MFAISTSSRFAFGSFTVLLGFFVTLQVLHFFNAPPSSKDEDLMKVFEEVDTVKPTRVRIFPVKPGAKSAAGLIEFDSVNDACEAVVAANHHTIPNPCMYTVIYTNKSV